MKTVFRGATLIPVLASILLVAACGSTSEHRNVSNVSEASRVDSILERAARDAKASGNTVETVALLEQIYQRNDGDAAIATSYGQALRNDQQLNKARQILQPFTDGKKPYPDAVVELAFVQLDLGQYKEAELTSRRAIELDPELSRGYLSLGTALDAQNYHEQAEVAYRRGIDKWKGDPAPILNNLALNLASQNKLDQALDLLERAKKESPGRMEIERNIRIISTLKEGANDFLIKEGKMDAPEDKKETKKPVTKKTPVKKPEEKKEAPKKDEKSDKAEEKKKAE